MPKKNTIKNIIFKILSFFKLLLTSIFSIFLSPFTKNKEANTKPKEHKKQIKNKNIKETTIFSNEEPNSRTNPNTFFKKKSELEELIIKIYCQTYNFLITNLTSNQKEEITTLVNTIIPIIEEKIKNNIITNNEDLNINIKQEIIVKKEKQQSSNLTPTPPILNETVTNSPSFFNYLAKDIPYQNKTNQPKNNTPSNLNLKFQTSKHVKKLLNAQKYLSITKLKDNYLAETFNHEYVLINENNIELTTKFTHQIVDYFNNYVIINNQNLYYLYDFRGNLIDKNKYLDIKLQETFYSVITLNSELDIHKYKDPKFKLSTPIPIKKEDIPHYEIQEENNKYKIKINNQEIYYARNDTGILENTPTLTEKQPTITSTPNFTKPSKIINESINQKPTSPHNEAKIETNFPIELETVIKNQNDNKPDETSLIPNFIEPEIPPTSKETKDFLQEQTPINLKEGQKQIPSPEINPKEAKQTQENNILENTEEKFEFINFNIIDTEYDNIKTLSDNEIAKVGLENKNYEMLTAKINYLLNIIEKQEKKKLDSQNKEKLQHTKAKLITLKNKIQNAEIIDIEYEQTMLNQEIENNDLLKLELELQKLYLENQIDLNEYNLKNVEDLLNMNKGKASIIEKKLLKKKLKRASSALAFTSLLSLPFLKNKYFFYFTSGLFISTHLNFCNNILKNQNIEYTKEDLTQIKKGQDSLEEALNQTSNNISLLNELEANALLKYPELSADFEYLQYLNNLKTQLEQQEIKMIRKKQMISKYNLQTKSYSRQLQKNKKAA